LRALRNATLSIGPQLTPVILLTGVEAAAQIKVIAVSRLLARRAGFAKRSELALANDIAGFLEYL